MILTFLFVGWAGYELSGGSDFEPPQRTEAAQTVLAVYDVTEEELAPAEAEPAAVVTRAAPLPETLLEPTQDPSPVVQAALVAETTVVPEVVPDVVEEAAVAVDLRQVTGNRVNMRKGPGTDYPVVGQLVRGDTAEVLQDPGTGWVMLRAVDGGQIGWMSARFVTQADG